MHVITHHKEGSLFYKWYRSLNYGYSMRKIATILSTLYMKLFRKNCFKYKILVEYTYLKIQHFEWHRILDIQIRRLFFSGYEYIQYPYLANLQRMNIFDIHIRTCWKQRMNPIFVFSLHSEYEYIGYIYLLKSSIDMFLLICPGQQVTEIRMYLRE